MDGDIGCALNRGREDERLAVGKVRHDHRLASVQSERLLAEHKVVWIADRIDPPREEVSIRPAADRVSLGRLSDR